MSTQRIYTQEEAEEMASMIDGVYEIVEVYTHQNQDRNYFLKVWADGWLRKARQYGASSE